MMYSGAGSVAGATWSTGFAGMPTRVVTGGVGVGKPYESNEKQLGRGMGIPKIGLLNFWEEYADGGPRHAGELSIAATWYCDDLRTAREGTDWLAPATRCEWDRARYSNRNRDGIPLDPDRSKLTLEGLRVRWKVTPLERESYLDRLGLKGAWRAFWRMVIDQWCDYGLVVAETAGWGMRSEQDGLLGPGAAYYASVGWASKDHKKAGVQEYTIQDFANVFADRIEVVRPAH
jgi:hypothetical protein